MQNKMTEKEKQAIDTYLSGLSFKETSKRVGISATQIRRIFKKYNLESRSTKTDKDIENKIIEHYKNGKSSEEIAKFIELDPSTVCRILKRNGIDLKGAGHFNRKYEIDEYFFEKIDTEEKAYVLGFLYADGCVSSRGNSFRFILHSKDIDILEKIRDLIFINKDKEINKDTKYISLEVFSEKIKQDLISHGCVPAKTFKLTKLPELPKELYRHFLRGFFDGDGSLRVNYESENVRATFTGYIKFLKSIKEFLIKKIDVYFYEIDILENVIDLRLVRIDQTKRFLDYLYKDSKIYLDRKYKLYLDGIKLLENRQSKGSPKIKKMIENGFCIKKIAKLLNLDEEFVRILIKDNNYALKQEVFKENSSIDKICDLYKKGVSAKQLGKKYSIDKRRVQRWVKERGLLRSKDESHRFAPFNQNKMDEIDSSGKAYWLGFFYADAYNCDIVNTVNIALKGSDIGHLEKLADFFELDKSKINREINGAGYDVTNIRLYSKHLCETLTEKGCPRAKSFIVKYPEWLPEDLDRDFIRGVFDGDGCLTYRKKQKEWKWSIAGTKEICQSIADKLFEKFEIRSVPGNISNTGNNTYCIDVSGNIQIKKICDWLYSDTAKEERLDRKFEKYQDLCKHQEQRVYWGNAEDRKMNLDIQFKSQRGTGFIDQYTAKCMMGPVSKNPKEHNGIFHWQVNRKFHFTVMNNYSLTEEDLKYLASFCEGQISFHYLNKDNLDFLVTATKKIEKTKYKSVILKINEIDYSGNRNKTIRNYMNRYKDFEIKNNFNNLDEVKELISEWSTTLGDKYFRDFSGKNKFFFMNNFHIGCENVFVYDKEGILVSFGVGSPVEENYCSYVIGKALAHKYPGLSEFTDMKLYEKLFNKYGPFNINMGQATGGLVFYKKKFPNSEEDLHYNGKILQF